jgi:hypothetical protein
VRRPPAGERPPSPDAGRGRLKKLLLALGMAAVVVWIVLLVRLLAPEIRG